VLGSTAEDPDLLAITCFNPDLPDINQFDPDLIDSDLFETDGAVFMAGRRDPAGCQVGLFGVPL